ncbi:MAG: hypothetical protein F8N39_14430 [Clostridiaceae bacterium]|nr:hypothetical protein [Clostridiaceae bacterium]
MTFERERIELTYLVPELKKMGIAGMLVGNVGELYEFYDSGIEFRGDFSLNIYNEAAALYS